MMVRRLEALAEKQHGYGTAKRGACDISDFAMEQVEETQEEITETKNSMQQIPPERVEAMKAYALQLKKKHPHLKPDRLKKKVAEYFKVKLV